jgi:hypothetical protein
LDHPSEITDGILAKGRGSGFRKIFSNLTIGTANLIHSNLPNVTPNHLTMLGTVTALGGAALAAFSEHRLIGGALFLTGAAMDGFDGALARIKDALGLRTDKQKGDGVIFDVMNDRYQEIGGSVLRMVRDFISGSYFGVAAESLNLMTNVQPSVNRAKAELAGVVVEETGNNPLEFAGSRPGRVLLGAIALARPDISPYLMSTVALGSYLNARSRRKALKNNDNIAITDAHPDEVGIISRKFDSLNKLKVVSRALGATGLMAALIAKL